MQCSVAVPSRFMKIFHLQRVISRMMIALGRPQEPLLNSSMKSGASSACSMMIQGDYSSPSRSRTVPAGIVQRYLCSAYLLLSINVVVHPLWSVLKALCLVLTSTSSLTQLAWWECQPLKHMLVWAPSKSGSKISRLLKDLYGWMNKSMIAMSAKSSSVSLSDSTIAENVEQLSAPNVPGSSSRSLSSPTTDVSVFASRALRRYSANNMRKRCRKRKGCYQASTHKHSVWRIFTLLVVIWHLRGRVLLIKDLASSCHATSNQITTSLALSWRATTHTILARPTYVVITKMVS